ncbi:hypothetical protein BKA93DRAFT_751229 [Sparassis latifolia]
MDEDIPGFERRAMIMSCDSIVSIINTVSFESEAHPEVLSALLQTSASLRAGAISLMDFSEFCSESGRKDLFGGRPQRLKSGQFRNSAAMPPRTRSAPDASEPRQMRSHTKGVQKVSTASESRSRNSAKKKKDVSPPKDEGHPATDGSKQKSSRTSKTTDVADEEAAESVAQRQGKAKLPAKRDTKAGRTSPSDSDGGDGKSVAPASEDDGIDAPSNNDKDTNLDSAEPDAHTAANLHRSVDEADAYNEDESSEEPAGDNGLHEEHGRTDVDRGGDRRVPNTEDSEDGAIYSDTQTIDEPMPGNRDRKLVLRKPTRANQPYVMLHKLRDIRREQDMTHDAVRKQQPQGQVPDDSMSDGGSDRGFALSSEGGIDSVHSGADGQNVATSRGQEDYDMSEYSGSDYSETKKVELMRCENRLQRRQEDVNTEQDDDLLDEEMVDDVVTELEVHGPHARTLEKRNDLRTHSQTVRGKGKQRVVQLDEAEEIAEREVMAGGANWQKSTGPFSKQARAAAVTFGEVVMHEAENLARKHGKSTRDVLILAGLSFKPSRAANPANKYRQWYSYHHPKADNVTTADYLKEVNTTYKKMFEGVDSRNDEQRALVMKPILDFCDSIEKDPSLAKHSMQSITARMLSAKDQFTALII